MNKFNSDSARRWGPPPPALPPLALGENESSKARVRGGGGEGEGRKLKGEK